MLEIWLIIILIKIYAEDNCNAEDNNDVVSIRTLQ